MAAGAGADTSARFNAFLARQEAWRARAQASRAEKGVARRAEHERALRQERLAAQRRWRGQRGAPSEQRLSALAGDVLLVTQRQAAAAEAQAARERAERDAEAAERAVRACGTARRRPQSAIRAAERRPQPWRPASRQVAELNAVIEYVSPDPEAGAGLSAAHARAHRVPPREKIAERPQSAPLVARATPSDAAAAEEYPGLYITAEGRARRRRQRAEGTQQLLRWMQSDKPRGGTSLSGSTKESKWRFTALVASLSSAFPLSRATSNS